MQVYSQIESCIKKQRSLKEVYGKLYSSLLPRKKHEYKNLTDQQSLALVYQHMEIPLTKLKQKIQKQILVQNQQSEQDDRQIKDQQIQEDDQQQNEQMDNQQQMQQEPEQVYEEQQQGQNMQEGQEQQLQGDEMISEEDVGLYGQQLDQQQMQSYQHEAMQDDPQFGNYNLNKIEQRNNKLKRQNNQQGDNQDQYIEQNFQQFRQVERQNNQKVKQQNQPTQIQKQIQKFQQRALKNKGWALSGQVKARERPLNSLIDTDLQFKSGVKFTHQITEAYNSNLQSIIKQRVLDGIFDDRIRNIPTSFVKTKYENVSTQKSNKGLAELYEIQFKNSLGLGDNKNEKLKKDIMDSLKQVNYFLDSLSNTGFALKPLPKLHKGGSQAIILEDKVPVTNWNGGVQAQKGKAIFESEKQIDKKSKRLRNKRNARQRKKQQDRKRMNKGIQYGGMTKIQAEARKKIAKSKQNGANIKYSKSNQFFKNINDKIKAGKPNPNISKLKI